MRQIRFIFSSVLCMLLIAVMLTGCGKSVSMNDAGKVETGDAAQGTTQEGNQTTEASLEKIADTKRKIIITADYTIETDDLNKAVKALTQKVKAMGGYFASSSVSGDLTEGGYGEFSLRIPAEAVDGFDDSIKTLGNIINHQQKAEDVTTKYYDTQTKLKSLRISQERIFALLEKANQLSDILQLETELNRIRTEIEGMTTQLKEYDNLVSYATVNLTLQQVAAYSEKAPDNFGARLGTAFTGSLQAAWHAFQSLLIALIWALPYLLVIGLIVFVVVWFGTRKKRLEKKAQKKALAQTQADGKADVQE